MKYSQTHSYVTAGGIQVFRASVGVDYPDATAEIIAGLDSRPGALHMNFRVAIRAGT